MLIRKIRSIGSGENAREVEEYEFDAALMKAMLELEKQAAIETGQWEEKTGGGPTTIIQTIVGVSQQEIIGAPPNIAIPNGHIANGNGQLRTSGSGA